MPRRPSQLEEQFPPLPPSQPHYWNEYDDGSEYGGAEEEYAIYINPSENHGFPGLAYVQTVLALPFERAKSWFSSRSAERQPLLPRHGGGNVPALNRYSTTNLSGIDSEDEYTSSDEIFPAAGYAAHYAALPSVDEQRAARYREQVLFYSTLACFVASFILVGISGVLISTGRHKLKTEVDAGVTFGVVISLFFACVSLGMTLHRRDHLSPWYHLAVWTSFLTACCLNGMLLILVVGTTTSA
jgi:hypothetical protein